MQVISQARKLARNMFENITHYPFKMNIPEVNAERSTTHK